MDERAHASTSDVIQVASLQQQFERGNGQLSLCSALNFNGQIKLDSTVVPFNVTERFAPM